MNNTICTISTNMGQGAISIIRVTGPETYKIVSKIFSRNIENIDSHTIQYGYIKDNDEIVDEVLLMCMKAPRTYTKEDLIEINMHGGLIITNQVLQLLLKNGCEMAEPGEFTKRAFLNGRIDLTEAESINDLIIAKTENSKKMAMNSVRKRLFNLINDLRKELSDIITNIEVNIDYPEYKDEVQVTENMLEKSLDSMIKKLSKIIEDSKNSKIIKDGINVAIVGKPNVGKSSLLNAFLDEDKAIVTSIAGTTRDIVEGSITLEGILLNFIDTAGIRETDDIVEKIGVNKSKEVTNSADLIILVLNNNEEIDEEEKELIRKIDKEKLIIFMNKSDLDKKNNIKEDYIEGNTIESNGIDALKKEIVNKLKFSKILSKDMTYISNNRQLDLIRKAKESLDTAIEAHNNDLPIEMIEIDIKKAWEYLGQITGEFYEDELVDKIFTNFCLGK